MSFSSDVATKAKRYPGRLVLPEGNDERIVEASRKILEKSIADEILLVTRDPNRSTAEGLREIDPVEYSKNSGFIDSVDLSNARISREELADQISDSLYFGLSLILSGRADAMVAGAIHPTADVLRAGIDLAGTRTGYSLVSSNFVMEFDDPSIGTNGVLLFTDAGVVPQPGSDELVEIGGACVDFFEKIVGDDPKVAFLSFSTHGSAEHEMVEKIRSAAQSFQNQFPDVVSDGELQADAALVSDICSRKAPESPVNGEAEILVFPDLDAANISYKLVQWLGGASAYGPFLQGINAPVNDLSRGCSSDDVVTVSAVTLLQAFA